MTSGVYGPASVDSRRYDDGALTKRSGNSGERPRPPMDNDAPVAQSRLLDAAETGQPLELVLVIRGRVRRARRGTQSWSVHPTGGRVLTFSADCVLAATPLPGGRRAR